MGTGDTEDALMVDVYKRQIVNNMLARAADKDYVDAHADSLRQFPDVAEGYWGYYQIMEAVNSHNYTKSDGMEDWTRLK